ncbi:hypothetical protein SCLCIDRAFT_33122 [Scleroderma citrinum Foug A]|uniref:Uncharacterized protein n=1 Tax=Scleroderma citrinum Foug A TaxID=1036808 RepID=A0A0C2YQ41_9AGAM|nr:hypothetical protein SCLCIDRAFT_33122 [Scleroderma citrinum Foug A]
MSLNIMHDGRMDLTLIQDLWRDSRNYAHETQASSNNFELATMVVDGPSVETSPEAEALIGREEKQLGSPSSSAMQVTSKTLTPAANDTPRPSNPSTPQPSTTVETLPDLAPLTKMIASGLNNIEECLQQLHQQIHTLLFYHFWHFYHFPCFVCFAEHGKSSSIL